MSEVHVAHVARGVSLVLSLLVLTGASPGSTPAAAGARRLTNCRWRVVLPLSSVLRGVHGHVWDLSATAPDDVWAGGVDAIRIGASSTRARPLLAHWDGRRWTSARLPVRWGNVYTVVARSRSEAWATVTNRFGTYLLTWHGNGWRRTPIPGGEDNVSFLATGAGGRLWLVAARVYARSAHRWHAEAAFGRIPRNARIVMSRESGEIWRIRNFGPAHTRPPIAERWDGTRWMHTLLAVSRYTDFAGMVAFSRRNVWLAGTDGDHAMLFRWNGSRWRRVGGPPPRAIDATVVGSQTGEVWLSGTTTNRAVTSFSMFLRRWDGRRWTTVTPPTKQADFYLHSIGRSEMWATTHYVPDDNVRRLSCVTR